MEKNSLLGIYNSEYVKKYNDKFLTNPFSGTSADYEFNLLKGLVKDETSWLDAGCGTGFFLSKFPGHKRAGMDISSDMLAEAKKVNPDALFFKEWDFRNDTPEWHGQWSLVSCMWYPYSYVESIGEVENVILNMVKWVKEGGELFLPIGDLEDIRPAIPPVPYEEHESVYGGSIFITSYTWTWIESDNSATHTNMVAPHIEHIIRLMEPFFETIEIVRYPPFYEGWVSRKAILARNKCAGNKVATHKAKIIRHPVPAPSNINHNPVVPENTNVQNNTIATASHKTTLSGTFQEICEWAIDKITAQEAIREIMKKGLSSIV